MLNCRWPFIHLNTLWSSTQLVEGSNNARGEEILDAQACTAANTFPLPPPARRVQKRYSAQRHFFCSNSLRPFSQPRAPPYCQKHRALTLYVRDRRGRQAIIDQKLRGGARPGREVPAARCQLLGIKRENGVHSWGIAGQVDCEAQPGQGVWPGAANKEGRGGGEAAGGGANEAHARGVQKECGYVCVYQSIVSAYHCIHT